MAVGVVCGYILCGFLHAFQDEDEEEDVSAPFKNIMPVVIFGNACCECDGTCVSWKGVWCLE